MAILKAGAAILGLVVLAGCERAPEPLSYAESSVGIYGLLVAGSHEARVLVTRFDPADSETRGVSDADVRLWSGADTVRLSATADGTGCLAETDAPQAGCHAGSLPNPPLPGQRWEMRVRLPDGTVATGAAVIPAPPAIWAPEAGTRIGVANRGVAQSEGGRFRSLAQVEVAPVLDPLTREFDVLLSPETAYTPDGTLPAGSCGPQYRFATAAGPFQASERVLVGIWSLTCTAGGTTAAWDSVAASVDVVAYDTAYSRYLRQVHHAGAVRRELASAGVAGAYGVFGAAARARRTVMLVAEP